VTTSILPTELAALAALLDVRAAATLLGCSARHVYRLSDGGKMPAPRRLGSLVRWSRQELLDWIAGGCLPRREWEAQRSAQQSGRPR
jgi:excisionase family DNA binding protein